MWVSLPWATNVTSPLRLLVWRHTWKPVSQGTGWLWESCFNLLSHFPRVYLLSLCHYSILGLTILILCLDESKSLVTTLAIWIFSQPFSILYRGIVLKHKCDSGSWIKKTAIASCCSLDKDQSTVFLQGPEVSDRRLIICIQLSVAFI